MSTNYEVIVRDLKEMREELAKEEVLGRNFNKFEKKFDKLFEIVSFQLLNDPTDKFYGTWLSNANRIKCYAIGTPLSHQVSNSRVNLLINPLLFINYTNEDAKLLMKHEVIHLLSEHHKRVDELKDLYPKVLPLLASDLIANHILMKEANKLPENFWTAETLKRLFNMDIVVNDDSTVEGLTKELDKMRATNELFDEFVTANSGAKIEAFLTLINMALAEGGSSIGQGDATFEEDTMKGLMTSVMQQLNSDNLLIGDMLKHITIDAATQSRGKFPGGLAGLIQKAMEPPVITWEEHLRRFIGSIAAGKKPSLFRRNRRQPERVDLKGELRDKEIDLVVAIDTSGSMSDKIISECMNEIFELVKLMKAEITIIECDSRIHKVYKANQVSDVQPEIIGRGGTAFTPVFEWLNKNKKRDAVLIFMSDGYGESKLACKANKHQGTLWLMTERKDCLSLQGDNLPPRSKVISFTNK